MALTTYVGGVESDSFVSLEDAEQFLDELYTPEDLESWTALSAMAKEVRLKLAAQLLGYLPLRGRTVFRGQRLSFPRTCQQFNRRFVIPTGVKRAQSWTAFDVIHRALAERTPMEQGLPGQYGTPSQISLAGLLSVSFQKGPAAGSLLPNQLVKLLPFQVLLEMKPFVSNMRGGSVVPEDEARTLSTTTVTETEWTEPSEPVTTTT